MTSRTVAQSAGVLALMGVVSVRPAFAEWTLTGLLGDARTRSTSLTLAQPAESTNVVLSPVHYRSESFEAPIYYGARIGLFPGSRWLGIEGEFIHLKVVADTTRTTKAVGTIRGNPVGGSLPISSVIERFSITHGVNLMLVNAVARRRAGIDRTGTPRWTVAARLGAGASIPHAESTIGGRQLEGYEWGAFSAHAAAGVEIRVAKRVSLVGEYKLTRTVQNVMIMDGTARTPLTTQHLVAGMALHFRAARP